MLIRSHISLLIIFGGIISGCATLTDPNLNPKELRSFKVSSAFCQSWSKRLDGVVQKSGARDFGASMVNDYPYLRVNRFLASFSSAVQGNTQLYADWIASMIELDQEGRRIEIKNLNEAGIALLGGDRSQVQKITNACSAYSKSNLLVQSNNELKNLLTRAIVPDDYSRMRRVLGLYSFLKIPFVQGIEAWHVDARRTFERYTRSNVDDWSKVRYEINIKNRLTSSDVSHFLSNRDSLGQLQLQPDAVSQIFSTYAPVFTIEDSGEFDRVGMVGFTNEQQVQVDIAQPTVYTHLAYTRFEGKTLPQLVYIAWFPDRPKNGVSDLLGGRLDGIIWRVTLDDDGMPLLFDSIHPCGCYHMFFPTERLRAIAAPTKYTEWAFSPKRLTQRPEAVRLNITVQTKTHYLANVAVDMEGAIDDVQSYSLKPYNELRSIKTAQGFVNLFGLNGIVKGSERGERFLLWPSGIRSPGAMRQWGRHATAFVGRRHFDDVDLLDKYYWRR